MIIVLGLVLLILDIYGILIYLNQFIISLI